MSTVYVLNKDGKPLMPTTRCGHVRYLLKEKKARVVKTKPFTIQLLYETNDVVQPLYLWFGRDHLGYESSGNHQHDDTVLQREQLR